MPFTIYDAAVIGNSLKRATANIHKLPNPPRSPMEQQILATNPTGYWPATEMSGTVQTDLTGLQDGVYVGSPTYRFREVLKLRRYPYFGSTSIYCKRAFNAAHAIGTGDFAVSLFLRGPIPTGGGSDTYEPLFSRDLGASGNGLLIYGTGVNLAATPVGITRVWCGGTVLNGSKIIYDNLPHHIWVQRVSGRLSIWVDGKLDATAAAAGSANGTGSPYIVTGTIESSAGVFDSATLYTTTSVSGDVVFWAGRAFARPINFGRAR